MPIKRIQLRHKVSGTLAEVAPAAAGYFPDFEPVDKPSESPAPAAEQPAVKKPRSAADK